MFIPPVWQFHRFWPIPVVAFSLWLSPVGGCLPPSNLVGYHQHICCPRVTHGLGMFSAWRFMGLTLNSKLLRLVWFSAQRAQVAELSQGVSERTGGAPRSILIGLEPSLVNSKRSFFRWKRPVTQTGNDFNLLKDPKSCMFPKPKSTKESNMVLAELEFTSMK